MATVMTMMTMTMMIMHIEHEKDEKLQMSSYLFLDTDKKMVMDNK